MTASAAAKFKIIKIFIIKVMFKTIILNMKIMKGVIGLLSLTLFTLVQSGPISFTLANNQIKCFKDDLAEGTVSSL